MADGIGGPRKAYGTDLLDAQWAILGPLLPAAKPGGRPRVVDLREVINAIWYQQRTGCQWAFSRMIRCPRVWCMNTLLRGVMTARWP